MSSKIHTVTVAGASGNIGLVITRALVSSGLFDVSALARPGSDVSGKFPSSVNILHADYTDNAALVDALRGQDAVVCAVDAVGNSSQEALIDAAVEASVKRFLPSHWAFDNLRDGFAEVAPVTVLKEAPIERLKALQERGMSWTAVVTGSWVDFFVNSPAFPFWDVANKTFVRFDDGETPFDCSSQAQVGRAVVAVLSEQNLAKTENEYVYVRSGRLTQNQVLEIFRRETKHDWTIVPNEAEKLRLQGVAIWDKWIRQEGKAVAELGGNEEWYTGVHMIVGGLIMGKWAMWEDKAKRWMRELDLAEEDLDVLLSEATKQALSASS